MSARAARLKNAFGLAAFLLAIVSFAGAAQAQTQTQAQIDLPQAKAEDPITIAADSGYHWVDGVYDVWVLRGNCYLNQGLTYARSKEAVIWIVRNTADNEPPHKAIAYFEGDVQIQCQQGETGVIQANRPISPTLTDKAWLSRFYSNLRPMVQVANPAPEPAVKPAVFQRGLDAREANVQGSVRLAQFIESPTRLPPPDAPPVGTRRLRAFGRSGSRVQAEWFPNPQTNESIAVISSGVNLIVDGLENFGSIDVATDRLVIWTSGAQGPDLTGQTAQSGAIPLELYMEGNIVFRQGDRIIYANRMYYDVKRQTGVVLNAEVLTPVPTYNGLVRLRADVLQQISQDRFVAQNASLTSSRLGVPSYEFRANTMTYEDLQTPIVDPATGAPQLNVQTGEPLVEHRRLATSKNNFLYLESVPVFYWPTIATDLEKPNYYFDQIRFKQDKIFGTQLYTDIDAYQLFGIRNPPKGTKLNISADYLSRRGIAGGANALYDRLIRRPDGGPAEGYFGMIDAWGVNDHGLDNLGLKRRTLTHPDTGRGRVLGRHRQYLPGGWQLTAEAGWVADRNFLEQFFEYEWDDFKDQDTGIELKKLLDNQSFNLSASARPYNFFMETQELPRFEHFLLGESVIDDRLTVYSHNSLSYLQLKTDTKPFDPTDAAQWGLFPYEANVQGDREVTRDEIDFPFSVGAVKVVPYLLGELGHWGQNLNGNDESRAMGQGGVRASLPMWSVDPTIESQLLNVHGIAHKVNFETDISVMSATQPMTDFPQYDQIDDNNIEQFRRKFAFTTFNATPATIPFPFDPRSYALRSGLASNVTSPSYEIAGDLLTARLGVRQRWQTKRGPIGNRRIVDWIVLNTEATLFPDAARDNFGSTVGLARYDFRWFVGDRLTITSEAQADFFSNAPKYLTVGAFLNRPPRGTLYAGIYVLEGPVKADVLATSYTYRMSPKWATTMGSSFYLNTLKNVGQNFSLTRIGESFLFTLGLNVDTSKGNVGANISIEPRFFQSGRVGTTAGVAIPPAGAFGLE